MTKIDESETTVNVETKDDLEFTFPVTDEVKEKYIQHLDEMLKRREENKNEKYVNDGYVNFDKIPVSDARKAAEAYGEGCESLTNFLETCFLNGIKTAASCAGHLELEDKESYVMFDITDEKTKKLIDYVIKYRLANSIHIGKIRGAETKDGGKKDTMIASIHVDITKRDEIYKILEKRIKEHENGDMLPNLNKYEEISKFRKIVKIVGEFGGSVEYDLKTEKITKCDEHLKDYLKKEGVEIDIKKE